MDQFYTAHKKRQEFSPRYHQPYGLNLMKPSQQLNSPPYSSLSAHETSFHSSIINKDPKTISNAELKNLLDQHPKELKKMRRKNPQQQLLILIDFISTLCRVPKSTLLSVAQNKFFTLLQMPFTDLLQRWRRSSSLTENEIYMFRSIVKLIKRFIKATDANEVLPSWLLDSMFLNIIADCLTNIATSEKFLYDTNNRLLKYFTRLIETYIFYQEYFDDESHSNQDTFVLLLDPILQCLTSSHYINAFTNISEDKKSMTTIEKLLLLKCPSFLISYNGSRLEQTMENLLSTMLPQYVTLLDKIVPTAHNWKRAMIRSVQYLLKTINHGANHYQINAKLVSKHLSLIDHVLKLLDEPIFYNNLQGSLSNLETNFINTAISFLVNMISEPAILAQIKESQVTPVFLRLTSCQYQPLVLNIYNLIADTTREEDIKQMHKPGQLLENIINSLKTTLDESSNDTSHQEQLFETLKGLVQHDQMKDEIIKQNAIPFLLECTNKLTDKSNILIFEILWSLTFREEGALALRSNSNFLNKIQTISQDSNNEPLKKAVDGLVWKLVREPENLERIAKRQAEEQNNTNQGVKTITEEIINSAGEKQLVTRTIQSANTSDERIFQYDMMISYCHADKDLIYKIHKFLVDQGFKIWIDLNNMYGPAMNAMADAVENSEFIILCMSDSYKRSTYCQAEAEYAFNCKRRLLPLIVREGYRPDGWLGFMIGSRIYVDFGRFDFDTACEKLITEISHQRKQPLPSKSVQVSQHEKPTEVISDKLKTSITYDHDVVPMDINRKPASNFIKKYVNDWTDSDVLDFLFTENLTELMPICKAMDGPAIIQLYGMCKSQSSQTFILLDDELKSTYKKKLHITVFTRFLSAMEKRLTTRPPTSLRIVEEPFEITYTTPYKYISYTPNTSIVNNGSSQYDSNSDQQYFDQLYSDRPYDLTITSNASSLQLLKAVEQYGPNLKKLLSI
ncbi:unnamed protein product [Rotaria sp. Silwood1]|nr:unnamed protein product [Rotaria sp. Silwood1]